MNINELKMRDTVVLVYFLCEIQRKQYGFEE